MEGRLKVWTIQALRMALVPENTTRNRELAEDQHMDLTTQRVISQLEGESLGTQKISCMYCGRDNSFVRPYKRYLTIKNEMKIERMK